jgi:heme/copper-type cytochrome/quinol oxidase subunit 2
MLRLAKFTSAYAFAFVLASAGPVSAQQASVSVTVKGEHFVPSTLHAPANKPIKIKVHNADKVPAEFESRTLRVEKIVPAGGTVVINVKPLVPGNYSFFDDFNPSNQGVLIAK